MIANLYVDHRLKLYLEPRAPGHNGALLAPEPRPTVRMRD